jgi:hypothetical protein
VHGWDELFARPEGLLLGLGSVESDEPTAWHESGRDAAPPDFVRRAFAGEADVLFVEPGVVIAEGDEHRLLRLDARMLDAWDERQPAVRLTIAPRGGARIELPVFTAHRAYLTVGTCTPVAATAAAETQFESGFVAPVVSYVVSGVALDLQRDASATRVSVARLASPTVRRTTAEAARRTLEGASRETLALEDCSVTPERSVVTRAAALAPRSGSAGPGAVVAVPWSAPK